MRKVMRKVIINAIFIVCLCIFCGCNNEQQQLHKFNKLQLKNYNIEKDLENSTSSSLLSIDKCIVDKTTPNTVDDVVGADGALLINITKKECAFSKNLYTRMYPASVTKLITALVAIRKCNISENVTITKEAISITESGAKLCGFNEGDIISLDMLLKAMLVYSGNDAALAIAIHVSGSQQEFANEMNKLCKSIGAAHTNFVNPHGLHDENQYTTPYDLYLVLNELVKYETIFSMYGLPSIETNYSDAAGTPKTKNFKATNRYMTGKATPPENITVLGGKTGTTEKAGSCLMLHCKHNVSANEYIAVVLNAKGADELYTQMTKVMSYAN